MALIYEWLGDFNSGRDAINAGRLKTILEYAHQKTSLVSAHEDPPFRPTPKQEKNLDELVKTLPRVAGKYTQT